jgi:hypothetical protein
LFWVFYNDKSLVGEIVLQDVLAMGCGNSSQATGAGSGSGGSRNCSYIQIINDKCPHIRLDHMKAIKKMQIEGVDRSYKLGYVYVSQRGYYPNGK